MNALGTLISGTILTFFGFVPPAATPNHGVEPLARGPIHEAFANPVDGSPGPGTLIDRPPPAPIDELPAEQKPDDPDVRWIPGYWAWDDARGDFLWVSGFWRVPPPGRVWVPGRWERSGAGWRWVPGFWIAAEQPVMTYLPPPPETIESGPSTPAPTADSIYVPGTWIYTSSRYVWRPGTWVAFRPGWVWIPACYRWTPAGYVFIDGFWDFPLARRGVLFTPVWIDRRFCYRPRWFYSPTVAICDHALYGALFVRPGCSHYFFGDYFDVQFTRIGYRSWFSVTFGRGFNYDPLWSYYQLHYRLDPFWAPAIREVYTARFAGHLPRPPVTIVNQVNNTIVNNVTNINNINIINNPTIINNYKNIIKSTNVTNVTNVNNTVVNIRNVNDNILPRQVADAEPLEKLRNLKPIAANQREVFVRGSQQLRDLAQHRSELEAKLRAAVPGSKFDVPQSVKLDPPQSLVRPAVTKPNIAVPPPAVNTPKLPNTPNLTNKPADPGTSNPANSNLPSPNTRRPSTQTQPKLTDKPANIGSNFPANQQPSPPTLDRAKLPNRPNFPQKPTAPVINNPAGQQPVSPNIDRPNSPNEPRITIEPSDRGVNRPAISRPVPPNLDRVKPPRVPNLPQKPNEPALNNPTTKGPSLPKADRPAPPTGPNILDHATNRSSPPSIERPKIPTPPSVSKNPSRDPATPNLSPPKPPERLLGTGGAIPSTGPTNPSAKSRQIPPTAGPKAPAPKNPGIGSQETGRGERAGNRGGGVPNVRPKGPMIPQ